MKNMKRSIALSICMLAATVTPAMAEEPTVISESPVQQAPFLKLTGTVTKLSNKSEAVVEFSQTDEANPYSIVVSSQTRVVDELGNKTKLQEGLKYSAYVDSSKPMILIYPPQYSPELIVVETGKQGFHAVGKWDKTWVNKELALQLNFDENTVIESLSGQTLTKEQIVDKEIAVFYTVTTRSIPAQTTPSKIILLEQDGLRQVEVIIQEDSYWHNGQTMMPLRKVAEQLGWKVKATKTGALLTRGNASIAIERGNKTYSYNRSLRQFTQAPALLEPGKTYVSRELLEILYP